MNNTDQLTDSIVKGIAYAENGGKPDLANLSKGSTGEEKSIFQFTLDTWKHDSSSFFGKEVPLTPDNETYVMKQKVSKWIKEGYTASQIASMHNAGTGEPNAYSGKFSNGSSSIGINKKYGVKFDVPSYAKKVLAYSKQFYTEKTNKPDISSIVNMVKNASSKNQSGLQGLTRGNTPKKSNVKRNGLLLNQRSYEPSR